MLILHIIYQHFSFIGLAMRQKLKCTSLVLTLHTVQELFLYDVFQPLKNSF